MERNYLGVGVKYPHEINTLGRVALVSGSELIRQSIRTLLETPLGADFDNPTRGSRINEIMWEPNDDVLESMLDFYIYEAIEQWEKRVVFSDTFFSRENSRPELLYCTITYQIKASNEIDSFVFPFYRELAV